MAFKFMTVPIHDSAASEAELNAFLGSHKILAVDRRWVDQGTSSFWSMCIDYLEADRRGVSGSQPQKDRGKVDYRERLPPEDFAVYAKLRELRKEISQAEAVPVYTLFTNDQLAQMVQKKVVSKAALATIEGIGEARVEKYGPRFLEFLTQQWASASSHETDGKPG